MPGAGADFGHLLILTYGKMKTMQPESHEIGHVSDTALMTAACRAKETERPDGLIRDPFAAQLAGSRGMAIAQALAGLDIMCFGIAVRTRFLDRLVPETVTAHGIATVLSIGAGLDTRPWRLELPATLRWIEVDFPAMLDYKDSIMTSIAPNCRRERFAADISDASERERVFAIAGDAPTLMITEGLLMYLPASTVEALAANAAASHWLLDAASRDMTRRVRMDIYQSIENVRAADHLDGLQILGVLERHGWVGLRRFAYGSRGVMEFAMERAANMFRDLPPDQIPQAPPAGDPSGVHLFARST
jgi:methyltransferase (TIGR00027 family)